MPSDSDENAYYERRARELGLPTDPEAYQDGGLGVAATGASIEEAELIAAVLKEAGVPAWVESPNMGGLYGTSNYAFFPAGPRVVVPMGRMGDAQRVVAEHAAQTPVADTETQVEEAEVAPEVQTEAKTFPPAHAASGAAPGETRYGLAVVVTLAVVALVGVLTPLGSLVLWPYPKVTLGQVCLLFLVPVSAAGLIVLGISVRFRRKV